MANMIIEDGKFLLTKEISSAGTTTTTLQTEGTYLDKDIVVATSTPAGVITGGATTVSATDAESILTVSATQPSSGEYITVTGQGAYSVTTAGFVASGTNGNTTVATKYYTLQNATFAVDGPSVKTTQKGYVGNNVTVGTVAAGTQTITGGDLSTTSSSTAISSDGCYNGTSYDTSDKVTLSTTEASGYYKITASGSAVVSRADVTKQVTTAGYFTADASAVTAITAGTQNVTNAPSQYYIRKSSLSASTVTSSSVEQTVTVYAGYYPSDRTITVTAMTTVTPTTSLANTGVSAYFTAGTSSDKDVTLTPQYSTAAGFVDEQTNTNNGGTTYLKIIPQSVTETATTVSGTTATRGTRTESVGWKATQEVLEVATFGSTAATGKTSSSYVNISDTTAAPVLVSGDYLYINKGWTDDVKISLEKLVPDGSDVKGHGDYLLSGHSAYDNDGVLVSGTITTYTGAYTVA